MNPDVIVLHCLPVFHINTHRTTNLRNVWLTEMEISDDVLKVNMLSF